MTLDYDIPTALPNDGARLRELDLSTVDFGTIVTLTTRSGSVYWVTRVRGASVNIEEPDLVYGLSIMCMSRAFDGVRTSPLKIAGDKLIKLGKSWHYAGRNTSGVMLIEVNDPA